jgi:hypothetical protein
MHSFAHGTTDPFARETHRVRAVDLEPLPSRASAAWASSICSCLSAFVAFYYKALQRVLRRIYGKPELHHLLAVGSARRSPCGHLDLSHPQDLLHAHIIFI